MPKKNNQLVATAQPLLFSAISIATLLIDIISVAFKIYNFNLKYFSSTVLLCIIFALAGFFQLFELIFVATFLTVVYFNMIGGFASIYYALLILLVIWVMRSWILLAIIAFLLNTSIAARISSTPYFQIFSSIFTLILVLLIGLALRWHSVHRLRAEEEKEKALLITRQTRSELARQLHDTTSRDLAHIVVLTQDLAMRHPDLDEELGVLLKTANNASQRIRPMILSIDTLTKETPLSQVIDQVQQMLTTRNIALETTVSNNLDSIISHQQRLTASLAIRECTSNILKYAPADSEAFLEVDAESTHNFLSISLTNKIASQSTSSAISSGYGLSNLYDKITTEGGTMEAEKIGDRWVTFITIPFSESPSDRTIETHDHLINLGANSE